MDKLIELLNEYWRQHEWVYRIDYQADMNFTKREETLFCSKYWWWIQRLVENDKIDFDKCWICYEINSTYDHYNLEDRQDLWLIMLLSISSSPIEDLVSYLK